MVQIHETQPVIKIGPKLSQTDRVVILLHGRGSTAVAMQPLVDALDVGDTTFWLPQAANNRWYPYSAFSPLQNNEPDLSSALATINRLVLEIQAHGVTSENIFLGGFSQGACLAAEFTARHANQALGQLGGLFVLTGALIGPPDSRRDYTGSLAGMPVFIGTSDTDPWVSHAVVEDTANIFESLGAHVDFRTYPAMGHTVNQDEISAVRAMLSNHPPRSQAENGMVQSENHSDR